VRVVIDHRIIITCIIDRSSLINTVIDDLM